MDPLQPLKSLKHAAFVAGKRARWGVAGARIRWADLTGRAREVLGPGYRYGSGRYPRTFLELPNPPHEEGLACPTTIYTIWFGDDMPPKRRASLKELARRNPRSSVVLVTEENLADFILDEHPLHPAFHRMAATHQSDHVRAYLMHFHGGGYSDLKAPRSSWEGAFTAMGADTKLLVTGYREITSNYVTDNPRNLGVDLRRYYRFVLGPSAFIMRPRSVFTASLYREQLRRMDFFLPALPEATPTDPYALPNSYPMWWTELFPDIVQCLSLKFQDRIRFDDNLRPVLKDYR